jgi:hypothetical protein
MEVVEFVERRSLPAVRPDHAVVQTIRHVTDVRRQVAGRRLTSA